MIAYAAIDLHHGCVVQLVGGDTDEARVELDDPVAVAKSWVDAGIAALHIVDLDAALGTGDNRDIVDAILAAVDVPVHVGGGVRTDEALEHWITAGVLRVIIGTRALQDREWLRDVTARYPDRIIVAADVRDGFVATHGWKQSTPIPMLEYLQELNDFPVAGVLVTDISREGQLLGVDTALFAAATEASAHPLICSGGVAGMDDLEALAAHGAAGVVLGMSLYTGRIDLPAVAREYAR
ncbi:MAG: 1-(5-phosphoribosyl)-5-[(5-phosphoribosylamino)methylideneamino] imidazole-4-carboxamide isomerase [Longimicrobiales bacterium]